MRPHLAGIIRTAFMLTIPLWMAAAGCGGEERAVVRIGFNIPLTGHAAADGESARQAAALCQKEVNDAGGLQVGDEALAVEFVLADNASRPESAISAALTLIRPDRVLGVVGPLSDGQAVPVGEICEVAATPMISPASTDPATTRNRAFVFRACSIRTFQGRLLAGFAAAKLGATRAAVLHDPGANTASGPARTFTRAFEAIHGPGSVVSQTTSIRGDADLLAKLRNIINSYADVLFISLPASGTPRVVKLARALGWDKPILGAGGAGGAEGGGLTADFASECGPDCRGVLLAARFAPTGAQGTAREFVESFAAAYGHPPDQTAALTWDAARLLLLAISRTGRLTGDLDADRRAVRDQLASVENFDAVTGTLSFDQEGDPIKCAPVVSISSTGGTVFFDRACPLFPPD